MAAPDLTQRECVYVQKEGTDDPGANLVGKPYSRLTIDRALLDLADTSRYPAASSTFFHIVSIGPGTFVLDQLPPPWTFFNGSCDGEGQPTTILLVSTDLTLPTAWNAGAARGGLMNCTLSANGGTPALDFVMPVPLAGNPVRSWEMFNVHHNLPAENFEATSTGDVWVRELCRQFGTNTDTLKQTGGTSRFNQNWSAASATIVDKTGFAAAGNWNGFIVTNAAATLTANSIAAAGCTLRLSSSSVRLFVLAQTAPGVLAVSADSASVPVQSAVSVTGTATIAANFTYLSDAAGEGYTPTTPGNWPAGIASVQQALDAIAAGSVVPVIPIPVPVIDGGTGATTPAGARTNLGLGSMATQAAGAVAITGGTITGMPTPTNPADVANKAYVDAQLQNFDIKTPVAAATTAALPFTPTYNNGASGVGATLTGLVGVLAFDGYTPLLGDRLLIKNQASAFQNGVYVVTTLGTIIVGYVLTRATDFNQTSNILYGDSVGVLNGTVNANQQFTMNNQNAITVGTTAITFAQTSGGSQLVAGTNIVITGNTIATTATPTFTTVNGNTFTTGTYTLTGAAGKTFTFSNSLTHAGTDGTTQTFPTTNAVIARTDAAQTFTGVQTFSASPVFSTGIIGAGDPGSTGGTSSGSCAPITLFVKSVTVLTAATPADIATITVPAGITRFICIVSASLSVIAETAAGTLAGATFVAFGAPGGSGPQMTLGASGPASAGLKTSGAQSNINSLFATATIYIRQTLNSANAGTCSFYITIFPLP